MQAQQTARDERRRRLAYYSSGTAAGGGANASGTTDSTPNVNKFILLQISVYYLITESWKKREEGWFL